MGVTVKVKVACSVQCVVNHVLCTCKYCHMGSECECMGGGRSSAMAAATMA